jgi:hypothetical protein
MLARRIEGAVKKECDILGDQRQFFVSLPARARVKISNAVASNRSKGHGWMRSVGKAGSRIGRHCREDRALNVTVDVLDIVLCANIRLRSR